jgi:hypothetical protein
MLIKFSALQKTGKMDTPPALGGLMGLAEISDDQRSGSWIRATSCVCGRFQGLPHATGSTDGC